jgi:rhodanese-related sulfurtransferase
MVNTLLIVLVVAAVFILLKAMNSRGVISVNAEGIREKLKSKETILLDVRTAQEFNDGHIKGARLIPVAEISNRINELAPFKSKEIVVYCRSGHRSATASMVLKKNGFTRVVNLQGGIINWSSKGYETVQ